MTAVRALFLVLICFTLFACASSPKVYTDFDSGQNFNAYKTYSWLHQPPGLVSGTYPVSGMVQQRIADAIQEQLAAKGFTFIENKDNADFLVSFTLGARDKIKTRTETQYRIDPYAWRWGSMYYPYYHRATIPVTVERPYQFTEGSIAVDVFDSADKRPVWHAHASKRLSKKELEGSGEAGKTAVVTLLAGFPPD